MSTRENLPPDVSLIIPARNATHALKETVQHAHAYLTRNFGTAFEILLVPNGAADDTQDQSEKIALQLAQNLPHVKVCSHQTAPGKGAAIRTGFLASKGHWIFLTDSDLPYDLNFFDSAILQLQSGYDLVTGNRRLPKSHFVLPVALLKLAYGRHRLGLAFNFLVRKALGIHTTDTQAGIKALSRRLATEVFTRQHCPGFLFDLEMFLTAQNRSPGQAPFFMTELPVTLHLNTEKSTVRIFRECIQVGYWLVRIWTHQKQGTYGLRPSRVNPLKLYRDLPWKTRLFLFLRWKLTPYVQMASRMPPSGQILDLGCGHGLFALTLALSSDLRSVLGIDHDTQRVKIALQATEEVSNLAVHKGNLTPLPLEQLPFDLFAGIAMIDVLHYFDHTTQRTLIQQATAALSRGGILLIREVDPAPSLISAWNRLYERIATQIGFTQSNSQSLFFRSKTEWQELLETLGFQVHAERCSSFLFSDVLYTCEKL